MKKWKYQKREQVLDIFALFYSNKSLEFRKLFELPIEMRNR
jgi:hypothetical protein